MRDNSFELVTQPNYFRTEGVEHRFVNVGASIADLVALSGIPERYHGDLQVVVSKGTEVTPIPIAHWSRVRPAQGAHVHIYPAVEGRAAAVIVSAVLPKVAALAAGALFATGTLGFGIAFAAFTIVGVLVVNALIPPPSTAASASASRVSSRTQDDPNFTITGSSNTENRYGIYPVVLGRHQMYPPKTARGYTDGKGENIYYRGRYTFGYGPVALESLRIGSTPITEMQGVELEFLNVDRGQTLARMPELAPLVRAWRSGTGRLTLYPDDIAEDSEQARLRQNARVVRTTRDRAVSVSVDVTFQGLVRFNDKNNKEVRRVRIGYRYRAVGGGWVDIGSEEYSGATTASLRFTKTIPLPAPGEYDIEVRRISEDSEEAAIRDDAYLTAIRSVQAGALPSHPEIAEVAVRIKASDQLNGQLDSLNAVVQQMAPVWTGKGWTSPKPVRHPAWIYARALMGPMVSSPVGAERLQLADLKAWADDEPHWTCDMVVDQPSQAGEILDLICAAGRARRTLRDLKYSVIRDGGAGPVIQQFTPRNSWGFQGEIIFPKEIHGFRVRCVSERLDWQQDEIVVYADGYHASNATEFETLDLRGVVISESDTTGGNAWRLGRYHLAQAILRPESFEWQCDIDHLRVNMGDKVRLVHDVPLIGVGAGRIRQLEINADGTLARLVLDELISAEDGLYRLCLRTKTGGEVVFSATPPVSFEGIWTVSLGQKVPAAGVQVGDLVSVEQMTQESMEVLITSIRHNGDLKATLTGVPAAPAVLQADSDAIPPYVPNITKVMPREALLPSRPVVQSVIPTVLYGPARVVARVKIAEYDRFDMEKYHVSLTAPSGGETILGPFNSGEFDLPLSSFGIHRANIRRENKKALISAITEIDVDWSLSLTRPRDVERFRADVVGNHVTLTWAADDPLAKHYEVRHLPMGNDGGWAQAISVASDVQGGAVTVPLLGGRFLIRAIGHWGQQSANASLVEISNSNVFGLNVVKTLTEHPAFEGVKTKNLVHAKDRLFLTTDTTLSEWPALSEVGKLGTYGGVAKAGEYALSEVVDLTAVYVSRVSADIHASEYLSDFRLSSWPNLSAIDGIAGSVDEGVWGVRLMMQSTLDDPGGAQANWTDWQEFRAGDYESRGYRFKLIVESSDPKVQVIVQRLVVSIDMPDRVDGASEVPCPPEGIYVAFQPPFKERPAITITGQELPSGFVEKRTQVSAQGFHMQFVDSAEQGVNCTFDWVAKGYGRET
ncbi:MAG: host specificity factor TipJ family phage tail protein [Mangrovicoccus sp.]